MLTAAAARKSLKATMRELDALMVAFRVLSSVTA